jgi:Tfp pilus assembly protein PilX
VLPIVLVILVVLTGLVVTQIRRSTVDERLAANAREYSLMDNAAQTVLRWCELRIVNFPARNRHLRLGCRRAAAVAGAGELERRPLIRLHRDQYRWHIRGW